MCGLWPPETRGWAHFEMYRKNLNTSQQMVSAPGVVSYPAPVLRSGLSTHFWVIRTLKITVHLFRRVHNIVTKKTLVLERTLPVFRVSFGGCSVGGTLQPHCWIPLNQTHCTSHRERVKKKRDLIMSCHFEITGVETLMGVTFRRPCWVNRGRWTTRFRPREL